MLEDVARSEPHIWIHNQFYCTEQSGTKRPDKVRNVLHKTLKHWFNWLLWVSSHFWTEKSAGWSQASACHWCWRHCGKNRYLNKKKLVWVYTISCCWKTLQEFPIHHYVCMYTYMSLYIITIASFVRQYYFEWSDTFELLRKVILRCV